MTSPSTFSKDLMFLLVFYKDGVVFCASLSFLNLFDMLPCPTNSLSYVTLESGGLLRLDRLRTKKRKSVGV